MLCGSILSGLRMQPGHWSGAYVCWGTENREAAVRFLVGGASNPLGANVEVKVIDPSANPYFATATILGLALDGHRAEAVAASGDHSRPGEPHRRSSAPTPASQLLPASQAEVLSTHSTDPPACVAFSAIRQSMRSWRCVATSRRPTVISSEEELADKFRMAWSL